MSFTDILPLLYNGGTAAVILGLFIYLVVAGHLVSGRTYEEMKAECKAENEELKAALTSERARGDAAVAAAAATRDLLLALGGSRDAAKSA